jgi:hypothetical protein
MGKWRYVNYPISYAFEGTNTVSFESKLTNPDSDKLLIENAEDFIEDLINYGMDINRIRIKKGPPESSITVFWTFDKRKVNLGKQYIHVEY